MGFKEDTEKLFSTWHEISFIWKVALGLMFVMQVLNFSSMADSIFKFKGFIVEGVNFYHIVTDPILQLFEFLLLPVTRPGLDAMTFWLLLLVSLLKSEFYPITRLRNDYFSFGVFLVFGGVSVYIASYSALLSLSLIVAFSLNLPMMAFYWYRLGRVNQADLYLTATRVYFFPLLLVCLIAAISEGLGRPLP